MIGLLATIAIAMMGFAGLSRLVGYRRYEKRLIKYALVAHFVGSLALIAIYKYYYRGGDLLGYHGNGGIIAAHLASNFGDIAPRLLALLFQTGGDELVPYGAGTSTGSMLATAGILSFLFGNSLLASSIFIATGAFYGKLGIYTILRRELAAEYHRAALIGCLLVPSAVFWSGSLLKESVVMSFLGALVWGGYSFATGRNRVLGATALAVGIVGCALFKAYLLVLSLIHI